MSQPGRRMQGTTGPALLLLLLMAASNLARGEGASTAPETGFDCGTLALYNLLRAEGQSVRLVDIVAHLPAPYSRGFSMKELREAARACGLTPSGAYWNEKTRAPDRPMLVFVRGVEHGHYLVIRPVGHTGKLVQVIDSSNEPELIELLHNSRPTR